ncbi:hypothetical protein F4818DRAFT_399302 [Hypoxylon cercidicola]|nr:hypothetical protein F4818DRAFT_399302 [Hypoxylon cercidicola]
MNSIQPLPEKLSTGIVPSDHLLEDEGFILLEPPKAPIKHVHLRSRNSAASESSQLPNGRHNIEVSLHLAIHTAVFIARYNLHLESKRRLTSESRLQLATLLFATFYRLLYAHGQVSEELIGSLNTQDYPIITFSSHIGPQHSSPPLQSNTALRAHSSDADNQVLLLLVVMTFLLFHESTLKHFENVAVTNGQHNVVNQRFSFSIFSRRPTGRVRPTDRNRRLGKEFKTMHRRRAFAMRRGRRLTRATILLSRRRRF